MSGSLSPAVMVAEEEAMVERILQGRGVGGKGRGGVVKAEVGAR